MNPKPRPGPEVSPTFPTALSRRSFLRRGAGAAAGLALVPAASELLAACGSSSTPSAGSPTSAAAGAATTAGAATAGSATASAAPKALGSLAFQFDWITNIQFGGSFVAQSKGYYKEAGVDVSLLTGGPNISIPPAIESGKALVGVSDPVSTAAANAKGAKLVMVGAKYQKSPNCIISLASDPILTPAQLVGKKVGIGATSIATMQAFMKANHLDYNSMHVVPIEFDPAPLAAGQVQGYFGFISNEAVTLQLEGHPVHTMLLADFGLSQYSENYAVEAASLVDPEKRAKIKAFLHAEIRGWQDVVANPQPAVDLVVARYGKALGLDPKEQALEGKAQNGLVTSPDTQAHGLFWMSPEQIQANLRALALTGTPGVAAWFDNSLLEEIFREAGGPTLTS